MSIPLNQLTPDQLQALSDFDAIMRPAVAEMVKCISKLNAVVNEYNIVAVPIISLLDPQQVLPMTSGLRGAVPLNASDPGYVVSYMQALRDYFNANLNDSGHQNFYTRAAGAINLI